NLCDSQRGRAIRSCPLADRQFYRHSLGVHLFRIEPDELVQTLAAACASKAGMSVNCRDPPCPPPLQKRVQQSAAIRIGPVKPALCYPNVFSKHLHANLIDTTARQCLERGIDPFFAFAWL